MITAESLQKRFDDFEAVRDVSLQVAEGEVLALLGPNGAGKTTTIRMLTAIFKPSAGRASVAGYDVVAQPEKVREQVGVLTEHHGLYLRNRGREYLQFFAELYRLPKDVVRRRIDHLLQRFGMAEAADRRIGDYSKGMRQKLSLIRAMLHDPAALLLDEPTSAMDPEAARQVRDAIAELRGDRRAIILCTHNLTEAEELADKIAIIRRGEIIATGTAEALRRQFLGLPEMHLQLGTPLNGLATQLAALVDVSAAGPDWLRYRTGQPASDNPRLLRHLAEARVPVVTLAPVQRSLESVYLQIMGQPEVQP